MARKIAVISAIVVLACVGVVSADWDPSQPAKWVQLPDGTNLGIDVCAGLDWNGTMYILADDFECTESGYITNIHIWGSWFNDYLPMGVPDSVIFTLSIHDDIPDSLNPQGYSMPGPDRWVHTFRPGEFTWRVYSDTTWEGWLNPPEEYLFPADWVIWQYNFPIPAGEQFYQQGTPEDPIVYWLDVQAHPFDDQTHFGWKTSYQHWNDAAVYGFGMEPYPGPWWPLYYPPDHDLYPDTIDLAFVIVGEESQEEDWGDAPDSPLVPGYPTLAIHNGARHVISGPWLGDAADSPDGEPDGQPDPNGLGDDVFDLNDDEDGVMIPILMQGGTSAITFEVNDGGAGTGGVVEAWIDFDGSRTWDAAELIVAGWFAAGMHMVNVTTPGTAVIGQTFARFRISSIGGLPPVGPASDGEVEDHEVYIEEWQAFKWIQRPDLSDYGIDVNATSPYILADDYRCTEPGRITEIWVWGSWVDDWYPFGDDPAAVDFVLSIHKDIPDSESSTGYSMPGDFEWFRYFAAGDFDVSVYADSIFEGWMNPPDEYWWPADWTCWLYRFYVPVEEAYFQQGTEANPITYWLDVQAYPHDPGASFGWKTSDEHWNDDAVWGNGPEPYFGPWFELRYPPDHGLYPHSIDLAFALMNEPTSGTRSEDVAPESFGLHQNVPNPFSSSTNIRFNLATQGHVTLEIFDVTGRSVSTLVDAVEHAGTHSATWSGQDRAGRDLPAGVYFYRLTKGNRQITHKMLLLR
ncbi:MAG: T9SS type A sorting domain-containing protein [Candidatus Eisenbacteria bacterium]